MGAGTAGDPSGQTNKVGRVGRPYDHSRDAQILAVTLDALAENDYEHMTLDAIALRAGRAKTTLYRRWPSKVDLVVAAVHAAGRPPEADALPDEGSLRADLLAVIDSPWLGGPDRRAAIFAGLTSAARSSPRLADTVRITITEPYVELYQSLLHRALERGQVSSTMRPRMPLLAQVIPAMSDHRLGASRERAGRAFFVAIVDDIVLPALQLAPR
ncbi:MAG: TetR/AcrR family transcriptional regulator [Janthinobacterium lividum]